MDRLVDAIAINPGPSGGHEFYLVDFDIETFTYQTFFILNGREDSLKTYKKLTGGRSSVSSDYKFFLIRKGD